MRSEIGKCWFWEMRSELGKYWFGDMRSKWGKYWFYDMRSSTVCSLENSPKPSYSWNTSLMSKLCESFQTVGPLEKS